MSEMPIYPGKTLEPILRAEELSPDWHDARLRILRQMEKTLHRDQGHGLHAGTDDAI